MKRLLALDGGGVRGFFSLEILARMETLLREKTGRPKLVLADHFDLIGGTSTGAIIAAALAWGMPVAAIQELYQEQCGRVFAHKSGWSRFRAKYPAEEISRLLRELFSEDGAGREPALLGSSRLRTLLLIVMRNGATGAPWPITNNPRAMFNQPELAECNLRIPLWRLVRASTAAPAYFPPEEIELGGQKHIFVDGGISPFNNPAHLMFLTATMPCYRLAWKTGVDKLLLVSVGTGRARVTFSKTEARRIHLLDQVKHAVGALLDSTNLHQDLLCRAAGHCLAGEPIDAEAGALLGAESPTPWPKQFSYARYNHQFGPAELAQLGLSQNFFRLDNLAMIDALRQAGTAFAQASVRVEHLLAAEDSTPISPSQ